METISFQSALYVLMKASTNRLVFPEETDNLLQGLFEKEGIEGYRDWLRDTLAPLIAERLDMWFKTAEDSGYIDPVVPPRNLKSWKEVLWYEVIIRALAGIRFQDTLYKPTSVELEKMDLIMSQQEINMEDPYLSLLYLSYADHLKHLPMKLLKKLPENLIKSHKYDYLPERKPGDIYEYDPVTVNWNNGIYYYLHADDDGKLLFKPWYVIGSIFALAPEVIGHLQYDLILNDKNIDRKTILRFKGDEYVSLQNLELPDRMAKSINNNQNNINTDPAVPKYVGLMMDMGRDVLAKDKFREKALKKLFARVNYKRWDSIYWFAGDNISDLVGFINPSELFFLGQVFDEDPAYESRLKRELKLLRNNISDEKLFSQQLNNIIGVPATESRHIEEPAVTPPSDYWGIENLIDSSNKLSLYDSAEKNVAEILLSLNEISQKYNIPVGIQLDILNKYFGLLAASTPQHYAFDWDSIINNLRNIDKEIVDTWIEELLRDGEIARGEPMDPEKRKDIEKVLRRYDVMNKLASLVKNDLTSLLTKISSVLGAVTLFLTVSAADAQAADGFIGEFVGSITSGSIASSFIFFPIATAIFALILADVLFGAPFISWIHKKTDMMFSVTSSKISGNLEKVFGYIEGEKGMNAGIHSGKVMDKNSIELIERFLDEYNAKLKDPAKKTAILSELVSSRKDILKYVKILAVYLTTQDKETLDSIEGLLKKHNIIKKDRDWNALVRDILKESRRSKFKYLDRPWIITRLLRVWDLNDPSEEDIQVIASLMRHPNRGVRKNLSEKAPLHVTKEYRVSRSLSHNLFAGVLMIGLLVSIAGDFVAGKISLLHTHRQSDVMDNRIRELLPGYDNIIWKDHVIRKEVLPVFAGGFRDIDYEDFKGAVAKLKGSWDDNALLILHELLTNSVKMIKYGPELSALIIDALDAKATDRLPVFQKYTAANLDIARSSHNYINIIDSCRRLIEDKNASVEHLKTAVEIIVSSIAHADKGVQLHACDTVMKVYGLSENIKTTIRISLIVGKDRVPLARLLKYLEMDTQWTMQKRAEFAGYFMYVNDAETKKTVFDHLLGYGDVARKMFMQVMQEDELSRRIFLQFYIPTGQNKNMSGGRNGFYDSEYSFKLFSFFRDGIQGLAEKSEKYRKDYRKFLVSFHDADKRTANKAIDTLLETGDIEGIVRFSLSPYESIRNRVIKILRDNGDEGKRAIARVIINDSEKGIVEIMNPLGKVNYIDITYPFCWRMTFVKGRLESFIKLMGEADLDKNPLILEGIYTIANMFSGYKEELNRMVMETLYAQNQIRAICMLLYNHSNIIQEDVIDFLQDKGVHAKRAVLDMVLEMAETHSEYEPGNMSGSPSGYKWIIPLRQLHVNSVNKIIKMIIKYGEWTPKDINALLILAISGNEQMMEYVGSIITGLKADIPASSLRAGMQYSYNIENRYEKALDKITVTRYKIKARVYYTHMLAYFMFSKHSEVRQAARSMYFERHNKKEALSALTKIITSGNNFIKEHYPQIFNELRDEYGMDLVKFADTVLSETDSSPVFVRQYRFIGYLASSNDPAVKRAVEELFNKLDKVSGENQILTYVLFQLDRFPKDEEQDISILYHFKNSDDEEISSMAKEILKKKKPGSIFSSIAQKTSVAAGVLISVLLVSAADAHAWIHWGVYRGGGITSGSIASSFIFFPIATA
ncbi:hypothetical protein ACFLTD_04415, partial [Elusimicrobiota bacterium]